MIENVNSLHNKYAPKKEWFRYVWNDFINVWYIHFNSEEGMIVRAALTAIGMFKELYFACLTDNFLRS